MRSKFEVSIDPNDKTRLRGFVRNEITYFNTLLAGFAPRLRTDPSVFESLDDDLVALMAEKQVPMRTLKPEELSDENRAKIFPNGKFAIPERLETVYNLIATPIVLHPNTRVALAREVLATHVRNADQLRRVGRADQALAGPVDLLHPIDPRARRHVQLPRAAVKIKDDKLKTAYNSVPISLEGIRVPPQWNIMIIRDDERPGHVNSGGWTIEFRNEKSNYLSRLVDAPYNRKNNR